MNDKQRVLKTIIQLLITKQSLFNLYIDQELLNLMSVKCPHNNDITTFCMKPDCNSLNIAGCSLCFLYEHNHAVEHNTIQIEEVKTLMAKFSFPKHVKPECVALQDSFFTYFKRMQAELKEMILVFDEICKNVVNTIGFPYITINKHFNVFKRIKNREYTRLCAADFQKFIHDTRLLQPSKIAEVEQRVYLKSINNFHDMVREIDLIFESFENITQSYLSKMIFSHDRTLGLKNKELVEKVKAQVKAKEKREPVKKDDKIGKTSQNGITIAVNGQELSRMRENGKTENHARTPSTSKQSTLQIQQTGQRYRISLDRSMARPRALSIDNQILSKKDKLEEKFLNLHKVKKSDEKPGISADHFENQELSKQKLNNINLPGGEENKNIDRANLEISIMPVTKRFETKLYDEKKQETQIDSPILKKKLKKSPTIKQQPQPQNSQLDPPKRSANPKPTGKTPELPQPVLPQLSQCQEKSFILLITSLHLQTSQAIPILQKCLQTCSKNLSAAQYLSYLYLESNYYIKCLHLCDKYINIISFNHHLYQECTLFINNKCAALNGLARFSETVLILENYQARGNGDINQVMMKNLANAYYGLGMLDKAIAMYQRILKEAKDDEVSCNLAGCLYLLNQFKAAQILIESAIEINPHNKDYLELQWNIVQKLQENRETS